jgi:hypothetical protein
LRNNGIALGDPEALVSGVLCAYAALRLAGHEGEQP